MTRQQPPQAALAVRLGPVTVLVSPIAELAGGDRRVLCDGSAAVTTGRRTLRARWPDGVGLALTVHSVAGVHRMRCTISARAAKTVDALGVRLRHDSADRILVDGYHSWDWAGLRDTTSAGRGWWGALWGARGGVQLALGPDSTPAVGALALRWDGSGLLDALTCGEPAQSPLRTGPPRSLDIVVTPGRPAHSDALRLSRLDPRIARGVAVPAPRRGDHLPRHRLAGWMSWNCLGPSVTAADVLAACARVPRGGLVLLDDGWMPWWGDWRPSERFGVPLAELAAAVAARERVLGLWLAPFLVDPRSRAAQQHAHLLLEDGSGAPVLDPRPASPQCVLDATEREARARLRSLGRMLGGAGIGALKLDFLYAGALPGVRPPGWSGTRALRAGLDALVTAYRRAAPRDAVVLACGAPAPAVAGLVDACRSGGDAVINVPTAGAAPPPEPLFLTGRPILEAQRRNLAARAWLWGSTLPPDVDAVSLGPLGLGPVDDQTARAWVTLARRSGGPLLVADDPHTALPAERRRLVAAAWRAVVGTPPRPAREGPPLAGTPAAAEDDEFLSQPAEEAQTRRLS